MLMKRHLKGQQGFSLIETVVAITLITVGALALATTFVGSAATNKRVSDRQQALSLARQQIDRIRSLDYGDVALFNDNNADSDWADTYCPLLKEGVTVCASEGSDEDKILSATASDGILTLPQISNDPRYAKTAPQLSSNTGLACATTTASVIKCPTVRRHGVILYTYIYWNNWHDTNLGKEYKLVTVVARYADPKDGLPKGQARLYTTASLTAVVADIPEVGQLR